MRQSFHKNSEVVEVALVGPPYSADPIDYDAFVHHVAFRSVYSSVVTQYRIGSFTGILVDSWRADDTFKNWEFHVRKGMRFENGDLISPDTIVRSWVRLAFLMKQKSSHSAFFDVLDGAETLTSPTSSISGLSCDAEKITIRLKASTKNLLDTLSFGLYAVVHPNDYDVVTGKWRDSHAVTASGPYRIAKWNQESIELNRRSVYPPEVGHGRPIQTIRMVWDVKHRISADMVMGNSIDTDARDNHMFYGGANSSIAYARCRSWRSPTSPCYDKATRVALREAYYAEIEKLGYKVTRSFFPLAIKGIRELSSPTLAGLDGHGPRAVKFAHAQIPNPLFKAFNEAAPNAIEKLDLIPDKIEVPFATFMKEYDQALSNYMADIYMLATGILIEDPMDDVRFMFLSREGIRLPDTDGSIHAELQRPAPDLQRINALLWDQAVVWPIMHYASGFWAKETIDFSLINLVLPPTDFQWLGWKQ